MKPYRVLVTGSRDWDTGWMIAQELMMATRHLTPGEEAILVHGGCPTGADAIADRYVKSWGGRIEVHPAKWELNGKRAGFIRNAYMVSLGADICLAFIKDGSRGASHTARLAEEAGIETRRYTA